MEQLLVSEHSVSIGRIQHICLRVRELQRSVDFYCGVLGFAESGGDACEKPGRVCRLRDADTGGTFALLLTEGLPPGDYLVGLDHLGFDVTSPAMVDRLYARAVDAFCQAAQPRLYNGRWKTYVFDPDGYKIEISAVESGELSSETRS